MMNTKGDSNIIAAVILIPITIACMLMFVYGFAPAIDAVLYLWSTISPDNRFYTESMHNNVTFAFTTWHVYVIFVAALAFVYLAINVYRKHRYEHRGQYENYYER